MGIPTLNEGQYSKMEIGNWWRDALEEEMLKAGEEEKALAIESNDFYKGVPAITVVGDGGWSKRSHKHTYNAMGGVGVIFGHRTKKLLHIGVRNRLCYICSQAQTKNIEPKPHDCYKNWSDSAQSMESDIILEGFLSAESKHGVRYMRLIGDGDSSTLQDIMESVPVWGQHVKKLECANHACKCLGSNLEQLVSDKPAYKVQPGTEVEFNGFFSPVIKPGKWLIGRTDETRCKPDQTSGNVHTTIVDVKNTKSPVTGNNRSKRQPKVKFVGRRISHLWDNVRYTGNVLSLISGQDGQASAIYDIHYDQDNAAYEVENLLDDYLKGELKFLDI